MKCLVPYIFKGCAVMSVFSLTLDVVKDIYG